MRSAPTVRAGLVLAALALPGLAAAAETGVSFVTGGLAAGDPVYNAFTANNRLRSAGVEGQLALGDNVELVARWGSGHRGSRWFEPGVSESRMVATFLQHEASLGARVGVPVTDFFFPFGRLEALGVFGLTRLDDDPSEPDNPSQLARWSISPGGAALLGVEFVVPKDQLQFSWGESPVTIAATAEAGYAWTLPTDIADMGQLGFDGFAIRTGIGLRF